MKAAQISKYGDKEVMQTVTDAPKPQANKGEVLVEVYAAAVNPFDVKVRQGYARQMAELQFPATLGGDFAGIVAVVGQGVDGIQVGEAVYGQAGALSGQGSFAEFVPVKAGQAALKPKTVDFVSAATLPLVGSSAYQALVDHAAVQADQKVLIHGGTGGIGSMAIQLARHLGAYVATTVAAEATDFAKSLGANEVINYKTQAFETLLKDYDVVFDTVGGETYAKSFQVLKPGGMVVSMVEQPDEALMSQYQVKAIGQFTHVTAEKLAKLAELVDQGIIKVIVDKVFPLEEASDALTYLVEGKHRGKVVIKVKDELAS